LFYFLVVVDVVVSIVTVVVVVVVLVVVVPYLSTWIITVPRCGTLELSIFVTHIECLREPSGFD
jgi:hypothetical protein